MLLNILNSNDQNAIVLALEIAAEVYDGYARDLRLSAANATPEDIAALPATPVAIERLCQQFDRQSADAMRLKLLLEQGQLIVDPEGEQHELPGGALVSIIEHDGRSL